MHLTHDGVLQGEDIGDSNTPTRTPYTNMPQIALTLCELGQVGMITEPRVFSIVKDDVLMKRAEGWLMRNGWRPRDGKGRCTSGRSRHKTRDVVSSDQSTKECSAATERVRNIVFARNVLPDMIKTCQEFNPSGLTP